MHLFSEALADRVKEFLNKFISFYEGDLQTTKETQNRFLLLAKFMGIPENEARFIYDTMNKVLGTQYGNFTTLIPNLDAAVARMGQYIATLQPAT